MDKKDIQEKRMKGYFLEAARKVVIEEGVSNLTVKKVADLAGYASGTLYNYFKDLNNLLFHCIVYFMDECKEYVLNQIRDVQDIKKRVIKLSKAYCEYFLKRPNVYRLMFLTDLGKVPDNLRQEIHSPQIVLILRDTLQECSRKGLILEENVSTIENLMSTSVHGLLLFFIKGRSLMNKDDILKVIEEEVNYLLYDK